MVFTDCESRIATLGPGLWRSHERHKARNSSSSCSNKPFASHRRKVRYTKIHGGMSFGSFRHELPERSTHTHASNICRRG